MSHPIKVASLGQVAMFRAYEEAGAAKTDLTATTAGLVLSVFRVGAPPVSIASLSDKAADDSAHAAGAIRHVAGNLYSVDIPDASVAVQVPSIAVVGSYTGGAIEGDQHPVVGYDATAPRVGASDFDAAADLVDIGSVGGIAVGGVDDFHADVADPAQIAAAVRLNLALELARLDQNVSAPKTLTVATMNALFDDSDASQQLSDFFAGLIDRFDDAGDTPVSTIASAMLAALVTNADWIELLADAEAARAAAVANGNAIAGLPVQVKAAVETPGGMLDTIRSKLAGITSLGSWLRALTRSDVPDAVAKSEINIGGGNYDEALHSLEAAEDARDANFQLIEDEIANIDVALSPAGINSIAQSVVDGIGDGLVSPVVLPASVSVPDRSCTSSIPLFTGETIQISITVFGIDEAAPVDLSGETLQVVIEAEDGADLANVTAQQISIGGDGNNVVSFSAPAELTDSPRVASYAIRRAADGYVYGRGVFHVRYAPRVDA